MPYFGVLALQLELAGDFRNIDIPKKIYIGFYQGNQSKLLCVPLDVKILKIGGSSSYYNKVTFFVSLFLRSTCHEIRPSRRMEFFRFSYNAPKLLISFCRKSGTGSFLAMYLSAIIQK